ncbi:sodium:glutamate symporter [Treponema sp. R8-4-B8]
MDFTMDNVALWDFILQMGVLATIMVLANIIRRKIPFIRKMLMPTAVIAGFLALALRATGVIRLNTGLMEMVTYHTIAIGFIALSLMIPRKEKNYSKAFTGSKSGALIVSVYLLQGVLGLAVSLGLAYTLKPDMFKAAGILLPLGFGQGPGQANNIGSTYEYQWGFVGGHSFALSIAAMGFVVACTFGVIYLNILRNKGVLKRVNDRETSKETFIVQDFQDENEIPVSESIDKLSLQVAFVFMVYLVTWGLAVFLTKTLRATGSNFAMSLIPLIWGFNFIFGSLFAVALRGIIRLGSKLGWVTRQYQNNYLLSRISGYAFDLMIVCGICTINFEKLAGLWIPFVLMCLLGTFGTLFYLKWICKKIYPDYYYEGFMSMYGMMTGVISSGILLLREIDPKFETPAATNLVLGSSFGIGFGVPMLIFIGMAPKSDKLAFITLICCIVYFFLLLAYLLFLKEKKQKS